EEGHILLVERAPFALPDSAERAALAGVRQASSGYHKNISYRPGEDRVKGLAGGSDEPVVHRALRAYSQNATRLLAALFPFSPAQWKRDFPSLRPIDAGSRE